MSAQPTPRPWSLHPGNWEFHPHVVGPDGQYVGGGDDVADHALIVAAVNDYDRLLAVEAAARDLVTLVRFGFLVTIGGKRAEASDVRGDPASALLHAILGAVDSDAAFTALARPAEEERG